MDAASRGENRAADQSGLFTENRNPRGIAGAFSAAGRGLEISRNLANGPT
jgi:hypothetical protein